MNRSRYWLNNWVLLLVIFGLLFLLNLVTGRSFPTQQPEPQLEEVE